MNKKMSPSELKEHIVYLDSLQDRDRTKQILKLNQIGIREDSQTSRV